MNPIQLYRVGRWSYERGIPLVPRLVYWLNYLIFHAVIPMSVEIGEGTKLPHGGMGVVLHSHCRIGKHVVICHQVTIGCRAPRQGVPVIEDYCYLGPGTKIVGPIRIGEGSVVGVNAVVLHDVPPWSLVAGVPARVIRKDINIEEYKEYYDYEALYDRASRSSHYIRV